MTPSYAISIIIPTYQRRASVERLLQALKAQTLPPDQFEVIVVIDGSNDGTEAMVAQFASPFALQPLWQPNKGRAAACNAGAYAARGELLVFLDDDMVPAPSFLTGHLEAHAGKERVGMMGAVPIDIADSSSPVIKYVGTKFNQHLQKLADPDYELHLRDFYSGNFSIPRAILLEVGPYDEGFTIYGNEDLELGWRLRQDGVHLAYSPNALAKQQYLKGFDGLARDTIAKGRTAVLLAHKHPETWQELKLSAYHQSSRKWRIVRSILLRLSSVWKGLPNTIIQLVLWQERWLPFRLQLTYQFALDYFYWVGARAAMTAQPSHEQTKTISAERPPRMMLRRATAALTSRLAPHQRLRLRRWRHRLMRPAWISPLTSTTPLSTEWGMERGTPLDRYYIEHFMAQHRGDIRGHVIEVRDAGYTKQFGSDVERSEVLDINAENSEATIIADLTAADAVAADQFDCFVLTQTLQFIYDYRAALKHAHRLLRPGGVLLVTVPAVSRIAPRYGLQSDYWRFTAASCLALFGEVFGADHITVHSYGNALTAAAFLRGVAYEELSQHQLDAQDPYFPVILAIRAVK